MTTNRVRTRMALAAAAVALIGVARPASATPIHVGFLSYDELISPDPNTGTPGVNVFNVANFTGSAAAPPDFPITLDLTLRNASLEFRYEVPDSSVVCGGTLSAGICDQTVLLGDLAPGLVDPTAIFALQLPSTAPALSATFTAIVDPFTFSLGGGLLFQAGLTNLSVGLPTGATPLALGDLVFFDVDGEIVEAPNDVVPEPATLFLVGTGLTAVIRRRRRMR